MRSAVRRCLIYQYRFNINIYRVSADKALIVRSNGKHNPAISPMRRGEASVGLASVLRPATSRRLPAHTLINDLIGDFNADKDGSNDGVVTRLIGPDAN